MQLVRLTCEWCVVECLIEPRNYTATWLANLPPARNCRSCRGKITVTCEDCTKLRPFLATANARTWAAAILQHGEFFSQTQFFMRFCRSFYSDYGESEEFLPRALAFLHEKLLVETFLLKYLATSSSNKTFGVKVQLSLQ